MTTTTATRERSIVLDAAGVRAILDGRKCTHRMPVQPQPDRYTPRGQGLYLPERGTGRTRTPACPYEPGGRLWVNTTMPREHSRIALEVLSVRAESLWEIRDADAADEGIQLQDVPLDAVPWDHTPLRYGYRLWWDARYATRGLGWDTNPYVWVVRFVRLTP